MYCCFITSFKICGTIHIINTYYCSKNSKIGMDTGIHVTSVMMHLLCE